MSPRHGERGASLVWFRNDLRLEDNPALAAAGASGAPVIPVFVWSPQEESPWAPGAASRWWLHESLARLDESLRDRGLRLVLRRGPVPAALGALRAESGAGAVFWNRRCEPVARQRDSEIEAALRVEGVRVESCNSALLFEPGAIRTKADKPFQVFTPFWRACLAAPRRGRRCRRRSVCAPRRAGRNRCGSRISVYCRRSTGRRACAQRGSPGRSAPGKDSNVSSTRRCSPMATGATGPAGS